MVLGMSTTNRITVKLPPSFNPAKHGGALLKKIAEDHGEGWEVTGISMEKMEAYAINRALMTEVSTGKTETGKPRVFEVRLGPNLRKPSDGERAAALYEDQYEGCYLVKFDPHLGKATLMEMSDDEVRARGALANALGVKPWDVMVAKRRGGGFDVKLPNSYMPSKHDDKLQEVAESVVGKMGWYVETDASKLTAKIIPSDPPTFPPGIGYPFKKPVPNFNLKDKAWAKIPLGMKLPDPGKDVGDEFYLDLLDGSHSQIGGVSGGGKDLNRFSSVKTPSGSAFNEDLKIGDLVIGANGKPTEIVGFSEWQKQPTYRLHFDDGQTVDVGSRHQWLASTSISRTAYSERRVAGRTRKYEEDMAIASRLRELIKQVKPGQVSSLSHISEMAGFGHATTATVVKAVPKDMANEAYISSGKPTTEYHVIELNDSLPITFAGATFGEDKHQIIREAEWMTARDIADYITRELYDRPATRPERAVMSKILHRRGIPTRIGGDSRRKCTVYPVGETLDFMARYYEENAGLADSRVPVQPLETVVSTQYMMENLTASNAGSNWGIRLASPLDMPESDLPVDPWVFGVWLGDGFSAQGSICWGLEEDEWMRPLVSDSIRGEIKLSKGNAGSAYVAKINGLTGLLRNMEVLGDKRIPMQYLRASYDQRLALLQGIVDTDGYVALDGQTEIALSKPDLARDVLELVRSLGIKASMTVNKAGYRNADGEHVQCKDRHRIKFTTDVKVARMPRKVERLPEPGTLRETSKWLYVTQIEVLEDQEFRCIKVADPHQLFLVEDYIPTHNSVLINDFIAGVLARGAELVIVDLPSKSQPLDTKIPVPVSAKFPDGWALLGEIEVGDIVYAKDGSETRVSGLSPVIDGNVYEIEFSDGQIVRANDEHLWPVMSRTDRARKANSYVDARRKSDDLFRTNRIDPLRKLAHEASLSKQKANIAGLAEIIDKGEAYVRQLVKRAATPYIEVPVNGKTCKYYSVDEFLMSYSNILERNHGHGEPTPDYRLMTTAEMADSVRTTKKGLANYAIPLAHIEGREEELPISPYVLGAWLGDGSANSGQIASGWDDVDEMQAHLESAWGHPIRRLKGNSGAAQLALPRPDDHLCPYGHDGGRSGAKNMGLYSLLEQEGLRNNKHIPSQYLRASYEQRLELVRGLMDTDGMVTSDGFCIFSSVSDKLADGMMELLRSLGIAPSRSVQNTGVTEKMEDGTRVHREVGTTNVISFSTDVPVFRIQRKADRLAARTSSVYQHRFVTDIRKVDSVPVRCITIEHPEHLFLTDGFIPTHNSVDFAWCKKFVRDGGWGCKDMASAVTALALVMEEGERRAKIIGEHKVTKWTELPASYTDEFKPIVVIVDELTGLFYPEEEPKQLPKDHPLRVEAQEINLQKALLKKYIKRIAAELRFVGVSLLLSSQVASANTGIDPSLRTNLHHKVLMGAKPTDGNRRLVLSNPERVPQVPANVQGDSAASRGTGAAEPEGQAACVFKSYYADVADFDKWLTERGVPTTKRPDPTASQIAKHTPSLADSVDNAPAKREDRGGERAPSGKSAEQVAREMGDDVGMAMHDGSMGTGYEKANNMRHLAAGGGPTKKQKAEAKEEAEWASKSGDVESNMMEKCSECGKFINPITGVCPNGHTA